LVTVETPRSQALIGFVKAQNRPVSNFSAQVENRFCTLLLSSIDDQPIANSSKLLLVAGGTVQNTGQAWNSAGTDVTAWGEAPTLIDPVKGTITLHGISAARFVSLQPIDGAGQPLGAAFRADKAGSDWRLPLGSTATTWYLVTVSR
jgi:hypothetical protein